MQKHVLARLMLSGGGADKSQLAEETPFTDTEIKEAVAVHEKRGWVGVEGESVSLAGIDGNGICSHFSEILIFWLGDNKWPEKPLKEMLFSRFYHHQINDELLDSILKTQADLPVPPEDRAKMIMIFRLSPSALVIALRPIQMITLERHLHDLRSDPRVNSTDLNLFYEYLIHGVIHDFNIEGLEEHILNYQGVFELEENLILRQLDDTKFELSSRSRHEISTSNTSTGYIRLPRVEDLSEDGTSSHDDEAKQDVD